MKAGQDAMLRESPGAVLDKDPAPDLAVVVRNLSKIYKIYDTPADRLKEVLNPFKKNYHRDFWALRDVNLEIPKGITFGIIGQNGSGKSTLLQIIAGILRPSSGHVEVKGRISALLELGAGFNKEFTGRENVFMQGAIMGISRKEMEARFQKIADFADIGHFINQPAKTYSSGMNVRLAFATAINVDPDILIVDEALSVGDAMFQRRCYRKIEEFQQAGKTIIFVSHGLGVVTSICTRALLLDKGKMVEIGESKRVVNLYTKILSEREEAYAKRLSGGQQKEPQKDERLQSASGLKPQSTSEFRFGSGEAEVMDCVILDEKGEKTRILQMGHIYTVRFFVQFRKEVHAPIFGLVIKTLNGIEVGGTNTMYEGMNPGSFKFGDNVNVEFKFKSPLNPGEYALSVGTSEIEKDGIRPLDRRIDLIVFRVMGKRQFAGLIDMNFEINAKLAKE